MSAHDLIMATSGAILLGYLIAGLLFWRFWRKTRERLFGFFALAFWILAVERIILIGIGHDSARHPAIYITRLIAFLVIIWAIWDRNRRSTKN
jgi:hypothetical protein